jgi:hypothetical protein
MSPRIYGFAIGGPQKICISTFKFYKFAINFGTYWLRFAKCKKIVSTTAKNDDLTLYEPVLSILSGGGGERHSPARPGVLYGRVALGSAGQGQAAAL